MDRTPPCTAGFLSLGYTARWGHNRQCFPTAGSILYKKGITMGIIKATFDAIGGGFGDQWLEVIEAPDMGDSTLFQKGETVRPNDKRNHNKRGTADVISNGSIIHVYPNQCMLLVDGGKIVDFTAEEGYYKVENSAAPSLFAGGFGKSILETFERIKYSGVPSHAQKVFFVNTQEIKGIKFGTKNPVNYFDNFYNSELFLRAHGTYSIKITDPLKFYTEVVAKNADRVEISDINEQYLSEFLDALQSAINRMSVDNIRISHVTSHTRELSKYMSNELDADWKELRGFEVVSVGIASVSYDDESKELINMRNKGAMLGDPSVREGYVQGSVARGMEAAGSNSGGSAAAFMGMGIGMNAGGGFMAAASESNRAQMENNAEKDAWICKCGRKNTGNFCADCGSPKPTKNAWKCECGNECTGKFCPECGKPKPVNNEWFCTNCGKKNTGKFCSECGTAK